MHALQTAQELHDEVVAELAGLQKQLGIDLGILPAPAHSLAGPPSSQAASLAGPQHLANYAPVQPRAEGPEATSPSVEANARQPQGATAMHSQQGMMATRKPSLMTVRDISRAESQAPSVNLATDIARPYSTMNMPCIGNPASARSGLLHVPQTKHMHPGPSQRQIMAPGSIQAQELHAAAPERGSGEPGKTVQCLAPQQSPAEGHEETPAECGLGPQSSAGPAGPVAGLPQHLGDWQQTGGTADAILVQQPVPVLSLPALGKHSLNSAADKPDAPETAPGWNRASPDDAPMTSHLQQSHVALGSNPASAVMPRSSDWSLGDVSEPSLLAEQPSSGWLTPSTAGSLSPGDDLDALLVQVMHVSLPVAFCVAM